MSIKFRFGVTHWKLFTTEHLNIIKEERKLRGIIKRIQGKEYGKNCPACDKPNNIQVDFCTGCGFPLVEEDVIQLPDNIFLDILQGRVETVILFRKEGTAAWNDKFGVSRNHIDVVSEEPIIDITTLNETHIPLLNKMYQYGLEEISNREEVKRLIHLLKEYQNNQSENTIDKEFENVTIEDLVTSGFNFPVSVKHLHLHMVIPPFKHRKVFGYPRWHSYDKVISDLERNGKVTIYDQVPNDEEGNAVYQKAIRNHEFICKVLKLNPDEISLEKDPTL